jgi:hypothetical protein
LVAGDEFFAFIEQGYIPPWEASAHRQNEIVLGAAAAAAGRLTAGGFTVVYDGVVGPWLLETFSAATGLTRLHYAVVLPPEQTCLDRVRTRVGHGFTDLDAARHMYRQFAGVDIDARHVLRSTSSPESIAASIFDGVAGGSLMVSISRSG